MYGSWSLLNPFLPLYFQNIGFSNIQIGLLMTIGPIVSLLANPFWGYWSDRSQNTRLILLIMLSGNFVASQLYFQMGTFATVLSFMLLFFFFQTSLNPLTNSLILQAIRGTSYSFGTYRLWGSLGFAVMVLAASPLIAWAGVENLGYLYGFFVLVALMIGVRLPKAKRSGPSRRISGKGMLQLALQPTFAVFLVLSALLSIPNYMNMSFISVYITDLGGSEVSVGWSWFLAAIIEVPIFVMLDRYLRTTARTMFGLMVLVSGLFVLRWLLMALSTEPIHIILIQLLHSVTFGVTFYTSTQLCNYLVPEQYRTSGQAIYGLVWMGGGGIVGGLLGGWLFETHGPSMLYLSGVFMSIAGMAGFGGLWLRYRRLGEDAPEEVQAE
ncbi:MFS transporter [Paenibacillus sp. IB182496]|uniref:MFS transporter n=2 Tax=Paenibacillus sabuli TaxID=2772509 RepID=A0A927BZS8_9BACL|nr:MFS transporter [Paenibacillus sabuli]